MGGVDSAVALDVENAVVNELAGRLNVLHDRFSVHHIQFADGFAFHHDADTLRGRRLVIIITFLYSAAYPAAEETPVRADGCSRSLVRVIEFVVLQSEVLL